MKSYLYHPEFLYYLGEEEAFESPLEPGVFLHASNATDKSPDFSMPNKSPYFIDGEWVLRDKDNSSFISSGNQISMAGAYIPYALDINEQRSELLSNGFTEDQVKDILGI
jgi:hypothetical protein